LGTIFLILKMSQRELKFDPDRLRYDGIIGTGGIGSGKFFVLNGDHTLGREESRSGHFLDINDYCKQHIILHYVKVLMGSSFEVIPVGKVGNDDIGQILVNEMNEAGFVMKWIRKESQVSTLFSFCFYYPDGSGGNLTTDDSASSKVDARYIESAISDIQKLGPRGIIMAAPEVPYTARKRLIELGKQYGLFCTASFTTGELVEVLNSDVVSNIDLIAINFDEAAAVAGNRIDTTDALTVVKMAVQNLVIRNSSIMVSITAGKDGSWCWDGTNLNRFPGVNTNAISSAGAGDAFFAGIISGLALGLTLFEAQQLASLVAGLSVCSPDTIHKGIDRQALNQFLCSSGMNFSETVLKLLEE
jgi:sugar/nucleoside kinase (ribokinase family)